MLPLLSLASFCSQRLDNLDKLLEVPSGVLDGNVGEWHLGYFLVLGEVETWCFLIVDECSGCFAVGVSKESFHNIHPVAVFDEFFHQIVGRTEEKRQRRSRE